MNLLFINEHFVREIDKLIVISVGFPVLKYGVKKKKNLNTNLLRRRRRTLIQNITNKTLDSKLSHTL